MLGTFRRLLAALFVGLVYIAPPGFAQTPPPFEDFTFRKVGVPPQDNDKRITIQIDPEEQARRLAPPEPLEEEEPEEEASDEPAAFPAPVDDPYSTFWALVSPRIEDAGAGRLDSALLALDAVDALRWPRLEELRGITDAFGPDILRHTVNTDVSPALVAAVILVESAGNTNAISSAGAAGLMQLMPATAQRFGVLDRSQASESIRGGVAYLDWLISEFGADPMLILAGYNAGEGAVMEHGGVPPYAETRAYVPKVLAAFRVASGLCTAPPQLISDPCVFIGPS